MGTHRILHQMYEAAYANFVLAAGQTVTCTQWGEVFEVSTAGTTDTLTLAQPTKPGMLCAVVLNVDGGDLTLTVTGGYNADGTTSITYADAGDVVVLYSIQVATSYYWRVLAQEGTNAAVEDLTVDQLTATSLTLNSTTVSASDMAEGAVGITAGTGTICEHSVLKVGGLIKTEIVIDLTGLNSGGSAGDIIGVNSAEGCYIGQITAAKNGTIIAGRMSCLETPTTGEDDIDLCSSTASTGATTAEDAAGASLAGYALLVERTSSASRQCRCSTS